VELAIDTCMSLSSNKFDLGVIFNAVIIL